MDWSNELKCLLRLAIDETWEEHAEDSDDEELSSESGRQVEAQSDVSCLWDYEDECIEKVTTVWVVVAGMKQPSILTA